MAFDGKSLDDYVDVAQRIADFRELYPSGSLQPANPAEPYKIVQAQGFEKSGDVAQQTFVVYVAAAYRTPDDPRPGIGAAWEVFPGRTNFTRGSELQNAETSAWGRAIIAVLASDSKGGIASREEVQNRRAEREDGLPVNADGSLSRSRTTDAEKEQAGVMTAGQQAAHTALRPKAAEIRGRVIRVGGSDDAPSLTTADPWQDQPAGAFEHGHVPPEEAPGSIDGRQRSMIFAKFTELGVKDRDARLKMLSMIVGRDLGSTNDLSQLEAGRALAELQNRAKAPADAS
jgi:hypothetical protein